MSSLGSTAKRTLGILALVAMIPASGIAFGGSRGGGRPMGPAQEAIDACAGKDEGFPGRHGGMGPGKHFARMAKELDLTEAQREQVKAILESERQNAAPLRQQLSEIREKIRKAMEAEPFDEAAVRALAASQNETRVELVVTRARVRSQIFALLTPEQREKAETLRPRGGGRHGHRPGM